MVFRDHLGATSFLLCVGSTLHLQLLEKTFMCYCQSIYWSFHFNDIFTLLTSPCVMRYSLCQSKVLSKQSVVNGCFSDIFCFFYTDYL